MSKKLRIAFGILSNGREIAVEQARMWLEIGNSISASHERFELVMFECVDGPKTLGRYDARNMLLDHAAIAKADWLVMMESNVWIRSNDPSADAGFYLLRMISDADRAGATMVAAPVPFNATKIEVFLRDNEFRSITKTECLARMFEVPAVGVRCVAINLQKSWRKEGCEYWSLVFDAHNSGPGFCEEVHKMGGRILVDGRVTTGTRTSSGELFLSRDD